MLPFDTYAFCSDGWFSAPKTGFTQRAFTDGSIPASETLFAPMMLDVSSEELLCAVLEFDPVEMTIGVANVLARVCDSVAPLNVTWLRTVSGS